MCGDGNDYQRINDIFLHDMGGLEVGGSAVGDSAPLLAHRILIHCYFDIE